MVGLERLSAAPAASLSGGETQRVAIARALALEPKVILCDEPVANVDLENQSVVVGLLREINRDKKITIVFSTHDRLLASSLADHTLYLDRGRLTSSPYDNLFRATLTPRGNGLVGCRIGDFLEIEIPGNRSGSARLHVDPAQVCLSRTPSGANAALGKIARLAEDGDRVRVRVESQLTIRVLISREAYRSNRFLVGEDVFFSIPPAAVELL